MKGLNPIKFEPNTVVKSIYSGLIYIIVDPGLKGMAKLKNDYGFIEDWNSCNNAHFIEVYDFQLKLF